MNIKIKKVAVSECGPLKNFQTDFSDLTLIYGKNEHGKSYLLKFIIQCLFNKTSAMNAPQSYGSGTVYVEGLEGKLVEFRPSSNPKVSKKIENFFQTDTNSLPLSLFQLLVVKEGETKISESSDKGIDKETIKDLLSQQKIFTTIGTKIPKTIKSAQIADGAIQIRNTGEGKNYFEAKNMLSIIDEYIHKIINEFELGKLKDLEMIKNDLSYEKEIILKAKRHKAYILAEKLKMKQSEYNTVPENLISELKELNTAWEKKKAALANINDELKVLNKELSKKKNIEKLYNLQYKSKCHEAYKLSNEITKLERELEKYPERDIRNIENKINEFNMSLEIIQDLNQEIASFVDKSKDYLWLKSAKDSYLKLLNTPAVLSKYANYLPILFFVAISTGVIAVLFQYISAGIPLIIIGSLCGAYYLYFLKKSISSGMHNQELSSIKDGFKKRFGIPLNDIATLEGILSVQEKFFFNLENKQNDLKKLEAQLTNIKGTIVRALERYEYHKKEPNAWYKCIGEIQQKQESLRSKINAYQRKLEALEVEESNYIPEDPGIIFNNKEFIRLGEELAVLKQIESDYRKKSNEKEKLETEANTLLDNARMIITDIAKKNVDENNISAIIYEIDKKHQLLKEEISKLAGELDGLGISQNQYEPNDPGKDYSPAELLDVEDKISKTFEEIKVVEQKLNTLKTDAIAIVGADASIGWDALIEKLYKKKDDIIFEIQMIEADIVAKIVVNETFQELEQLEDDKISKALKSPTIKETISKFTGRYNTVQYKENDLVISNEYDEFLFKDLSTGAKEQVMLALRIGFLKHILHNYTAFLLLDDAFQHSDYERRQILVKSLFEIAQSGWQVIYFSMDDHIRSLFLANAKNFTGFREIQL